MSVVGPTPPHVSTLAETLMNMFGFLEWRSPESTSGVIIQFHLIIAGILVISGMVYWIFILIAIAFHTYVFEKCDSKHIPTYIQKARYVYSPEVLEVIREQEKRKQDDEQIIQGRRTAAALPTFDPRKWSRAHEKKEIKWRRIFKDSNLLFKPRHEQTTSETLIFEINLDSDKKTSKKSEGGDDDDGDMSDTSMMKKTKMAKLEKFLDTGMDWITKKV